jgi:hypothetical protein
MRNETLIEIIALPEREDGEREWVVAWPEQDGSRGSFKCGSCELAVEQALLIRTLLQIQRRQEFTVAVTDDCDMSTAA